MLRFNPQDVINKTMQLSKSYMYENNKKMFKFSTGKFVNNMTLYNINYVVVYNYMKLIKKCLNLFPKCHNLLLTFLIFYSLSNLLLITKFKT